MVFSQTCWRRTGIVTCLGTTPFASDRKWGHPEVTLPVFGRSPKIYNGMDAHPDISAGEIRKPEVHSTGDLRLPPTSDYGSCGPNSDIVAETPVSASQGSRTRSGRAAVVALGILLGLVAGTAGKTRAWEYLGNLFTLSAGKTNRGALASTKHRTQLDRTNAQDEAQRLLESAIGKADGANEEISMRSDSWRGKLTLDAQLGVLTTAALNSDDLRVRQSGLEVQLAAYGLAKNASTVDALIQNAASSGHAQKIWALWAMGALANRGVETGPVERVLVGYLKDADEDSRRWAVEALGLVGTTTTIPPLLDTMHDDPSPAVRERAACTLAESGMLSHEQRLIAVPQLMNYAEDSSLDSQTHAWAFQVLGDITKEHLPNDPSAWRVWYASTKGE